MEVCAVCGDHSTGRHYGANTCEGCKLFFKRSIKKRLYYTCRVAGSCPVNKRFRNSCQYCRMKKCLAVGMKREAVQQTRAQDFAEKTRRRHTRKNMKGEGRKGPDFASLSDYVMHLQDVEPYQSPQSQQDARSTSSENTTCGEGTGVGTKLPIESFTEMAARLLFMTVHWAKNIRHFSELRHLDQVTLLRENWCKIFILNLVQWAMPLELAPLVAEVVEKTPPEHLDQVLHNIGKLNEVVFKVVQLQLDRAEFSLLKALALFNPDSDQLSDSIQVQAVQNKTHNALEEHTRSRQPQNPKRFGQLLLKLTTLGAVDCKVIEHVFFKRLLGGASIYTLVDDILRAKTLGSPAE